MGRAGTRYRFVCADAGRSCAGFHGHVHGAGSDEFGGAGAAAAVWNGRAEEKIFAAHGDGGNAGSVLPDGAGRGFGCGGGTITRKSRGRGFGIEREEENGGGKERPRGGVWFWASRERGRG